MRRIPPTRCGIPRLIVSEVRDYLSTEAFREFILYLNVLTTIHDDFPIPFEPGEKYPARGLKPADAFIGAYAEGVDADVLVTENRHFLSRKKRCRLKCAPRRNVCRS